MAEPVERFSFQPLERRGLLLGLRATQLVVLGSAVILAFGARVRLGPSAGTALAAVLFVGGTVGALWVRDGEPLAVHAGITAAYILRRRTSLRLDPGPVEGHLRNARRPTEAPPARQRERSTSVAGIGIETMDGSLAGWAVVHDRLARHLCAVIPVGGPALSLLDRPTQGQSLEAWRRVLGTLDRPGSPVTRLQWIQTGAEGVAPGGLLPPIGGSAAWSSADDPHATVAPLTPQARSYRSLVGDSAPRLQTHDTWLVVAVAGRSRRGCDDLAREVRLLQGQLRQAGLDPGEPLDQRRLVALVGGGGSRAWPMATREHWDHLERDGRVQATFWVAEWPRVDVAPDFLSPLLLGAGQRTVSVVMAPIATDKALREIRAARTADVADEELRAKAGFLPSARRQREAAGVIRREAELADGHSEFRFSGYVTVSAADLEGLTAACVETEHLAQSSRLELRRLYGRQAVAATWTLPLARGLR